MAPPSPGIRPPGPPPPGPLPGTEPLTTRNIRRLCLMTVLHLDPGVFGFMVFVAAVIGAFQLIGDVVVGRDPDVAEAAVWAASVFVFCLLSVPFSFLWTLKRLRMHGWVVGYFDETATLLVHAAADGSWEMSDHHAAKRGRQLARPFLERAFRHLAGEADRHRAVIVATTLVPKLASSYQADMPGLTVVDGATRSAGASTTCGESPPDSRRRRTARPRHSPGARLSRVPRSALASQRPDRGSGSPTTTGTAWAA